MSKIKILGLFVAAVFFLSVAMLLSGVTIWSGDDPMQVLLNDPVAAELMAYVEAADEVRENPSPTAKLAHYQEWKERFQKVIADNPRSQFVGDAKDHLLSLYNGLGEYDKSQTMLQVMISETRDPRKKLQLQNELGTISRVRHRDSQNQSDIQKAQEAFAQANEIFLSLSSEERDDRIVGMQVVNLYTAAMAAREANDHARSVTLFRSARELFLSSTKIGEYATSMGYSLEPIANQEMVQWIRVKEETNALECLKVLSELPSPRWSPSHYALNYATLWYVNDTKGFQGFVSKWLSENAFDDETPILMARLGFSYFDDGLYDKALPIYETLRDKHREDFQKLEPKAFQQGNDGHYERVLFDLAKIYAQRGDVSKAANTKTELTTLLPQSSLAEILTGSVFSSEETWTLPERPRYLALRISLAVVGLALILLALYLLWTREKE